MEAEGRNDQSVFFHLQQFMCRHLVQINFLEDRMPKESIIEQLLNLIYSNFDPNIYLKLSDWIHQLFYQEAILHFFHLERADLLLSWYLLLYLKFLLKASYIPDCFEYSTNQLKITISCLLLILYHWHYFCFIHTPIYHFQKSLSLSTLLSN